jgi:hypothetical protein
MRKLTLALAVLALLTLPACQSPLIDLVFDYTGEERPLSQVRGMGQLAANVLHARPQTASDVPVAHAGVNPLGINIFLNQEVEPEKRERSVQMIADAGFHWLRQEFTARVTSRTGDTNPTAPPGRSTTTSWIWPSSMAWGSSPA